jgi:hypothetical protein
MKANIYNLSEENHENISALEGGCVHGHMKKAYTGNPLRKITRKSRLSREVVFTDR